MKQLIVGGLLALALLTGCGSDHYESSDTNRLNQLNECAAKGKLPVIGEGAFFCVDWPKGR